jgi:hypothetical protein
VTLTKLVEVFRANGVTLDINRRRCRGIGQTNPDATNMGPSGLDPSEEVERREGSVLCYVGPRSFGRDVEVLKYRTDTETHVRSLNLQCSVYPSDAASEAMQVARLKRAFEALVRATP